MNPSIWIPCFVCIFIVFYYNKKNNRAIIQHILNKKNRRTVKEMEELVKEFIGKECLIYTINDQLQGTIKEVTQAGIIITNNKTTEVINLEYVIRVREYPRGKNGKKKSIIQD